MLYERWCGVVRERAQERALLDLATQRQWSFAELARAAEDAPEPTEPVVYPQGHSAEFVFAVLRAWRWRRVVCPLEPGQGPPRVPLPPSGCVHLKLTSATTGAPRVIAFTGAQLAADAENIVATMGLRSDWPNLGAISMAHSYGFSNLVLPLLLHGIPLLLAPSPLPAAIRRAAEAGSAFTLPAVPALWRAWHEAGAIPPNVRLAISAGAPLALSLERGVFAASGLKVHNFYGASECGGIAYDRAPQPRQAEACVGTPLENVSLSVQAAGCLCVRSRAAGETYWPDADDTLGPDGFQTSDLAELKDGEVWLRGRLSDQINVAGRKVSPAAIEQVLGQHPAVDECLVFGVPSGDADRADAIVACVVSQGGVSTAELRQFLLQRLPAWQVPRDWRFVSSLALSQRGKVSRAEWCRRFEQGQIQPR
jgi:acyl-coenzyme A synthetase/AMP-(fatty) acid ligase